MSNCGNLHQNTWLLTVGLPDTKGSESAGALGADSEKHRVAINLLSVTATGHPCALPRTACPKTCVLSKTSAVKKRLDLASASRLPSMTRATASHAIPLK